ncbi:AT-rich interactive domain containing protein 1A [Dissostichus eleginoides]|uniref:AT-rich interactive domain containing protein 1A n=1 Tax=Dissostichus eleginoides TaxID=100907 RepID=A0AAD9C2K5_DISEL|nr:AT-rich interactive domain containing protein 1A [Dissostichus eleginoides]
MDFMAMKRSQLYSMANNAYSSQQQGGGPYPPNQPYTSPPPHRYPMSMQGRPQMGMAGMQYPQQQAWHVQFEIRPKIPGSTSLTRRHVVVSLLFITQIPLRLPLERDGFDAVCVCECVCGGGMG